jgi:hypothetical protein
MSVKVCRLLPTGIPWIEVIQSVMWSLPRTMIGTTHQSTLMAAGIHYARKIRLALLLIGQQGL